MSRPKEAVATMVRHLPHSNEQWHTDQGDSSIFRKSLPAILPFTIAVLTTVFWLARPPNGLPYASMGYWCVGRMNIFLPEPTQSHGKCLETGYLPPVGCTQSGWQLILFLARNCQAPHSSSILPLGRSGGRPKQWRRALL